VHDFNRLLTLLNRFWPFLRSLRRRFVVGRGDRTTYCREQSRISTISLIPTLFVLCLIRSLIRSGQLLKSVPFQDFARLVALS
jgi:hypothetical protein